MAEQILIHTKHTKNKFYAKESWRKKDKTNDKDLTPQEMSKMMLDADRGIKTCVYKL